MAKSKKSKILASMLAASTMAVFYVAPVMAAELEVELDGQGIVANEEVGVITEKHEVTGTLTIAGAEIATALTDTDLTLNSVTANTISTTGNNFIVGTDGNVSANSVTTSGDVVTLSGDVLAGTYSLKDIGVITQNMTATEGNTVFTGNVSATGTMSAVRGDFGGTVINAQGINAGSSETFQIGQINVSGRNLSNVGYISGDTLNFKTLNMGEDGNDTLAQITGDKVRAYNTAINAETGALTGADGSVIGGVEFNGNGTIEAANGAFSVDTNGNVTANRVTIGDTVVTGASVTTDYLLANSADIDGVLISGGLVDGVDVSSLGQAFDSETGVIGGLTRTDENNDGILDTTTIEGSTSFDANGMNVGNGAVVANTDGSFRAANGAFDVDTNGNVTANRVTVGNTVVTGTSVTTDVIYANEGQIGGTLIKGGFVNADNVFSANYNLEEVGDNLADLTGSVGNIGDNVAGITRDAEDGAVPGEGTTTIENTLSVSGDSVLAQVGSSQLVITEDVAGLSSGNASFALSNNELQLSVAGNGLLVNQFGTNLNGTVNFIGHDGNSYTLANLEGRVYDLEQKTQNITSADPGQGGGSEVPPTDEGHTGFEGDVTVGGDINADEGNFNKVNTDEITVGDSTFIDGDSVNSNEGNFKDKVTVGGEGGTSITGDGMTVGTADKGTTVSDSGVSIKNEYGSVETGVVDGKNDVVVTDEDGNRTSLVDTAGRVDNLEQGVAELNNRVGELEDRIDKVGAMAAAIANLRTMGYDPAAPTEVAVGIGQYRDETGAALGLFHYPNRDFMLSLSVSTSGDEVMGGIGATWKFGRKSPEKVAEIKKAQAEADARRAEEAKLAKAEEMKQAAKEAKIKAQQERHAKLAAERAAQAEAAK